LFENAIQVLNHGAVWKTPNAEAVLCKEVRSCAVASNAFGRKVLSTIQFDDQLCIEADEVDNVWSDRGADGGI
jgi:hypothetical protein